MTVGEGKVTLVVTEDLTSTGGNTRRPMSGITQERISGNWSQ